MAWRRNAGRSATGRVACLVARLGDGVHRTLTSAELSPTAGLVGDRWGAQPTPATDLPSQISLIDARVVAALVEDDAGRFHTPGDNVVVDFDLDEATLPAGARLRLGSAEIEITPELHSGCKTFRERLGDDALRFVNAHEHKGRRLRGVYARVLTAGHVALGDSLVRIA